MAFAQSPGNGETTILVRLVAFLLDSPPAPLTEVPMGRIGLAGRLVG